MLMNLQLAMLSFLLTARLIFAFAICVILKDAVKRFVPLQWFPSSVFLDEQKQIWNPRFCFRFSVAKVLLKKGNVASGDDMRAN